MVQEDGSINVLKVKDVSWASALGHNLLSTVPLAMKGVEVFLRRTDVPTQLIHENKIHGLADVINRQYVLRIKNPEIMQTNFANTKPVVNAIKPTIEIWHQRMGHLGYRNILKLPKIAEGIKVKGPVPEEICGPCMKGRQQRKPSRTPMPRASKFLEEVHSDLGGPYPASRNGLQYYISFKDDATGTYHVYPMKLKSQAFEKAKEYIEWTSQETGMQMGALHSDGGGEYDNEAFQDYLKKQHIRWKCSAPYTPEQNGKAERLNYTLMSSVRSILSAMKLPKGLWPELIKAVCYLKNRSPNTDGVTPYEKLNNKKPNLGHLRVLGARAWVHIPKEKRKKLDERSWQGIHVGYEGTNQYRIYDPCTDKVHVTRDVTIDEKNLFDRKAYKSNELVHDEWAQTDDDQFGNPDDFDDEGNNKPEDYYTPRSNKPHLPTPPDSPPNTEHSHQNSVGDSQQTRPEGRNVEENYGGGNYDSPYDSLTHDPKATNHEAEATDTETPEASEGHNSSTSDHVPLRRSKRAPVKRTQYPDEIFYGPGRLPKRTNFTSTNVAKSHIHMMKALTMLANNIDNEGPDEPLSLKEAMARPDWPKWMEAMKTKIESHTENGTWELTEAPKDRRVITGRWVFKLKKDRHGNILKYKARWVVHGYKQEEGLDYIDTFTAVVKPMSYKAMMGVGVKRGFTIRHMDVVTAFLYGYLDELIFVEQPHLFNPTPHLVCKLIKALYGLKQSPQVWYQTLVDFLKKLGFHRLELDHGVFVSDDKKQFIAIYVDDLLLFGADIPRLEFIQKQLSDRFKMTNLGDVSHYLGMEIDVDVGKTIILRQSTYLKKVLDRFGMTDCKQSSIPMDPGVASSLLPSKQVADKATVAWYQSAIGSLMWPAVHTRPDISYSVGVLSRYCSNPGPTHIQLVKQIFRYLAGTLTIGLTFSAASLDELIGYTDSDWAGTVDGRKSTGGYVWMLSGCPISHQSKQQPTVALSSCEAEYMAITEAGKEALWCSRFLEALGHRRPDQLADLRADNKVAIDLTANPEFHKRTKHIDVRHHWIREVVLDRKIIITYISTNEMIADGMTKPLPPARFKAFRAMMGMR